MANIETPTTLVLGPVLFNWKPEDWRDFYFRIAEEADIDEVFVGEVVCSKRSPFFAPHIPEVVERLQSCGKRVVLSTLGLIMNKREMESVRDLADDDQEFMVEANDISAAALLAGRPHAIGPMVNVYNEGTLDYLAERGAVSVCLPVELGKTALASMASHANARNADVGTALEVMVFGRLPLAISARCYHARAHKLHKDSCQFVCDRDPNGMEVETLDNEPFVAVNGVQTMSHAYTNLGSAVPELLDMGINRLRLSPHHGVDMVKIAALFRAIADKQLGEGESDARLAKLTGDVTFCNGYFEGTAGHTYI